MSRVHLVVLGCVGLGTVANGAISVVERDQVVQSWLNIQRRDPGPGGTIYVEQDVYFGSNGANTILPDIQPTTISETASLNDTLTDMVLVAEGSGLGFLSTTLSYNGSDLASFTQTGILEGYINTGTLAGYQPSFSGSEVYLRGVSLSNASFSFTTDVPVPYSISAIQSDTVGTLFSGAQLYSDVNGDKSYDVLDGDISIESFGFSADGSEMHSGVLPASPFEYRVFFGANTFDETTTDNVVAMASSGEFTGAFTVVPEPTTLFLLSLGMPLLLARRRNQIEV